MPQDSSSTNGLEDGFSPSDRIREIDAQVAALLREKEALAKRLAPKAERYPFKLSDKRPVVLIGGSGGMGRLLNRWFTASGAEVRILEKSDWDRAAEILKGAGIVIVSVPIDVTLETIDRAAPFLERDALLTDVTSVKTAPLEAMLTAHPGPVCGLHPMFGPDVKDARGQVFVYSPGRFPEAAQPLLAQIAAWGARVVACSAADHDRAMSIIQALRHFTTYVYGVFLAKIRPDLYQILDLSSPIYRLELQMVGRLFAQDPHLYGDIIMSSKEKADLIEAYADCLQEEVALVKRRDIDGFVKKFLEARDYFGELAPRFMKESGALLNKIRRD